MLPVRDIYTYLETTVCRLKAAVRLYDNDRPTIGCCSRMIYTVILKCSIFYTCILHSYGILLILYHYNRTIPIGVSTAAVKQHNVKHARKTQYRKYIIPIDFLYQHLIIVISIKYPISVCTNLTQPYT